MGFEIGIKDIIDIVLVAFLMYQVFKLLRKSGAMNIFIGIFTFLLVWFLVSYVFKMELLGGILDKVISVGAFALIVLFQDEIRRFFSRIGSRREWALLTLLRRFFKGNNVNVEKEEFDVVQIVLACRSMSKSMTGSLIVVGREQNMESYLQSGEIIDAKINSRLIENLFFKNSPLHDGAMLITNHRIKAAGCILPISKNQSIPKKYGLRHRSAIGITEISDAIAIVVSEETGKISYAIRGELTANVKPEELEMFLSSVM